MLPYESMLLNQTKPAEATVYELPYPSRAFISTISVSTHNGASITPTVDVLSKHPDDIGGAALETPYKVVPSLTLVGGKVMEVYTGAVPFMNHDTPDGRGVGKGKIYIRVNGTDTAPLDIRVAGYGDLV